MALDLRKYRSDLDRVLDRLQSEVDTARIIGHDHGQFLFVERGDRGIELYCGEEGAVVIDPAIGDDLQGEITFPSYDAAVEAATKWLNGADWDTLQGHAV